MQWLLAGLFSAFVLGLTGLNGILRLLKAQPKNHKNGPLTYLL
jgi:hypothetical protein